VTNRRNSIFAAIILGAVTASAVQAEPSADTVVASVNGTEITVGHMILVREGLPEQYRNLPNEQLFDGILEQLIQQTLLADLIGDTDSREIRLTLENDRRLMKASQAVEELSAQAIGEDEIAASYDARYADADMGMEYDASHILVETEEAAVNLIDKLQAGADFVELAKEFSTGPSGPGGGALGWFGLGMMVPPFEAAVVAMEKGAISSPVKTDFGWHVIKLNDTRAISAPALGEVRSEIIAELQRTAIEGQIEELRQQATINRTPVDDIGVAVISQSELMSE
jgi:peptidyl-prolyl cis-trans isomerase C|tara:strand:+ start:645 stop:1493 length:849 start_codon:yes stop_codon:yes gene_type:complete